MATVTFLPARRLLKWSVAREKVEEIQRNRSLGWQKTEFRGASGTDRDIRTNVIC
jgi:hypothetical protein